MHILSFLFETLFAFLVAAALLRAWMNQWRVSMVGQPGRFVIALSDWLVKPLRRVLPSPLRQSRVDWGSLLAAALLALAFGLLWMMLFAGWSWTAGASGTWIAGLLWVTFRFILLVILRGLMLLLLLYAVLSWVQPQAPVMHVLSRLCDPLVQPIRRLVPSVGGVDLSVLLLLLLLQIGLMWIG